MDTRHEDDIEKEDVESPVLTIARQYFLELAAKSDSLRTEMNESTTRTKQQYLMKKLRKNNKEAIDILSRLDNAQQQKMMREAAKEISDNEQR